MAGRGWRLPSPCLFTPCQQEFPRLPGCWASWPDTEPSKCAGESKGMASLLGDISGTSYVSPAGETQIPVFTHFPSLLESNLIEAFFSWLGFLLPCVHVFLIQKFPGQHPGHPVSRAQVATTMYRLRKGMSEPAERRGLSRLSLSKDLK